MYIDTPEKLRALYEAPNERAKKKQLSELEEHSTRFIQLSPFLLLSTYNQLGQVDASPRGGAPGFVKIINRNALIIADAKGNNRLDSLVNIVETGSVGCLFLIPGVDEVLRVNGKARISTHQQHLNVFSADRRPPRSCIEITISEVFLHCAKAIMRAQLWEEGAQVERSVLPTMNRMIHDQLNLQQEPESQDSMMLRYNKDL
ncbi:phosphohydrolase [Gammaproteobacteria bacterium 45_16_T64]|nr:phosphohydrolase [Gammaproteobacteria bacterium 45_16_T64]